MKKIMLAFIALFSVATFSFAQQASAASGADLANGKKSGIITLKLPSDFLQEDVENTAKVYAHYFTVDYNPTSHDAKITMASNDERSRHVITRFLVALGVQEVSVDGKVYTPEDFYVTLLK